MIDLRSDVKSIATPAMLRAMVEAEVGDDAGGEDPTVRCLEERSAKIMGKEAAVFVTSGTQGNLTALLALTEPGQELVTDELAHLLHYESGGCVRVAGLFPRLVPNVDGCTTPEDVAKAITPGSVTQGATGIVVMENTHNLAGGMAVPPQRMQAVAEVAWDRGVKVHVDGARIFNASVALGLPASDFARWCDTITFCFSKGLGAPAGSVVCGSAEVIERVRFFRRLLGGAMRQSGHLAATALVALDTMVDRLAEDHRRAHRMAEALAVLPGVTVDPERVQTNMVYFALDRQDLTAQDFVQKMADCGILLSPPLSPVGLFRLVTHHNINDADTERVCTALQETLGT